MIRDHEWVGTKKDKEERDRQALSTLPPRFFYAWLPLNLQ